MAASAAHTPTVSAGVGAPTRIGVPFVVGSLVLLAIFIAGMVAWGYQFSQGLIVTGMRNVVTWGLYIAFFMLFVGLSAGGLIVASAGTLFGARRLVPLAPLAIWVSLVTVLAAALLILPDMGHPERLLNLFLYAQVTSPLIWDIAIIFGYAILSAAYLWLHVRPALAARGSRLAFSRGPLSEGQLARNERLIRRFAYVALPLAIAIHSITAWIFGLQPSRPYWDTAILAPLFITSALVSGLGLMLVVILTARRFNLLAVPAETISLLGGLLAVFIATDFFMLFADYLTALYAGGPSRTDPINLLLSGQYSWVLIGEIILGVAAFVLLFTKRARAILPLVGLAGALAIVSVFLKRFGLIAAGLHFPLVDSQPGIPLGDVTSTTATGIPTEAPFAALGSYSPTIIEFAIIAGILALWVLVIAIGIRFLPIHGETTGYESSDESPEAGR